MKTVRYRNFFMVLTTAGALLFGPSAARAQHVVATGGDSIVLSSGSDAGVKKGMTGKICAQESVGGHIVTNCSARFVVASVSKEKSIVHITKGDANASIGALANFDEKLAPKREERESAPKRQAPPPKRDEAAEFLQAADLTFRDGDYRGALERYENFLRVYPNHDKADFAADRAYQCRMKLAAVAPAAVVVPPPNATAEGAPPVPSTTLPVANPPVTSPAAVPLPPEVPTGLRQADTLAATAEGLFQTGQFSEARTAALEALRKDSTNPRARTTLRAVQVKLVQSRFNMPTDVAVSDAGCYVADAGNNTIRLIKASASETVAGSTGQYGFIDGSPARARFNEPNGLGVAKDGTVYVSDRYNSVIRKIALDGTVTTVAGRSGLTGNADGVSSFARFNGPRRIAIAADGTIYVADTGNHAVRRILPNGIIETVVVSSGADRMDPVGLDIDGEGNVLVADAWNHVIRRIDRGGRLSIAAGLPGVSGSVDGPVGSARFNAPEGVAVDANGAVYIADTANHTIRRIVNGVVTTVAGRAGLADAVDGSGAVARLNHPSGIRCDARGRLWIADSGNNAVRLMSDGFVETVAGLPGSVGNSDGTN